MIRRFLARLGHDWHVQAFANNVGDLLRRDALIAHAVIARPSRTLLKHKSVKMCGIEPMHCGPSVKPVADICRTALFPCNVDESRNEAVIAFAVDRWRKPHD